MVKEQKSISVDQQIAYEIEIQGRLDKGWSHWFDDMDISVKSAANGPTVTSTNPVEGATIPGIMDYPIEFNFSTDMNQAGITEANFVLTSIDPLWTVVPASLNWRDSQTVQIRVNNPDSIPAESFTITLVGFADVAGTPLGAPTSFVFNMN